MVPTLLLVLSTVACLGTATATPLPLHLRMASRVAAGSRDVWLLPNVAGEIHVFVERTAPFATDNSAMGFCATPAGSSTPCRLSWGSSPLHVVHAGAGDRALEVHVGVTGDSAVSYTISWCPSTDLTCAFQCPSGCHGQGMCDTTTRTCLCDPWRQQGHDCGPTTERYGDYPYDDDDDGLPTGAIVGIVVVCVVACLGFVAPVVVLCICCCGACAVEAKNKKKRRGAVHSNPSLPADVPVTPYGAPAYPGPAYPMQAYPQTVTVAPPPFTENQMTPMQPEMQSYPPAYVPSAPPPATEVACYPPPS